MVLKLIIFTLLLFQIVFSSDVLEPFEDPVLEERYERIISEVRCLKCQNQTIKDSNAFLAGDLRREIRLLIENGSTDEEIFTFLVDRYGQFALYRPAMSGATLILWVAPFVLLLGGGILVFRILRKRSQLPIEDTVDIDEDAMK